MTVAVVLIVVGLVVGIGGFIYVVTNMGRAFTSADSFSEFDKMFSGHLKTMAVMAVGGFLFVVGLVLGGWQVIQQLLAK